MVGNHTMTIEAGTIIKGSFSGADVASLVITRGSKIMASGTPTVPVITLSNPGPAMGDGFGGAVAISGIRLVVGAAGDSTGAPYAGSAYVYDLTSGTPAVPVAILNDPNPMMYDNFGIWESVPSDLRLKIVSTLSQMRWTLKEYAVVVLFLTPGSAPEVEEAFAAARRVVWDFDELWNVTGAGCAFDESAARVWMKSASLTGELPLWADALLGAVAQGTLIESACAALRASAVRLFVAAAGPYTSSRTARTA